MMIFVRRRFPPNGSSLTFRVTSQWQIVGLQEGPELNLILRRGRWRCVDSDVIVPPSVIQQSNSIFRQQTRKTPDSRD